jgi:ABC-type Fe3+/spermidine/putrescine transport system ATPase subunit
VTAALQVSGLEVRYGDAVILEGIDLTVEAGEVVAVLGPSGSGKTTLLFAAAGFIPIHAGRIDITGATVATPQRATPPEQRDVAVVFQSYALWPHLSALETVAFPLRAAGAAGDEADREAHRLLEAAGIAELAGRRPAQLSGGQQQRVGLARALARRAGLYLFDEPTAHLDAPTRTAVQAEIAARRAELGSAAVYATHDAAEALAIAGRVALLREGRLVQVGTPDEVYERPADRWAAELTGPVSILETAAIPEGLLVGDAPVLLDEPRGAPGPATVAVRPDWAVLGGPLPGTCRTVWFRGPHTEVVLDTPAGEVSLRVTGRPQVRPGDPAGWSLLRAWRLA